MDDQDLEYLQDFLRNGDDRLPALGDLISQWDQAATDQERTELLATHMNWSHSSLMITGERGRDEACTSSNTPGMTG